MKTGEMEYVTPVKMSQSIVGFPKAKRLTPEVPPVPPVGAANMLNLQ
jgi:hypothetical protein